MLTRGLGLELFQLDRCAGFGKLGLDLFGFVLRNAFLERFRSAVDQVLRFLEAEARDDFANDLDDRDLVASSAAAAPPSPAGAAIIIGAAAAAAETPNTSSSSFTSSEASRRVIPFKYSTTSSFVVAISFIYLLI